MWESARRGYIFLGQSCESYAQRSCGLKQGSFHRSSNKMPAAVRAAVRGALEKYGQMSEEDAKEYVATMEKEGKLVEDCWD